MFTFVVIGCNRLYYLKNCVSSVLEFVGLDNINLLVIDNASSEDGTVSYLNSLDKSIDVHRFKKRSPNELHRAMNYAIKYAKNKGDKYINFIQDDYQYLYHQPDMLHRVSSAFDEFPKVVQLHTNLIWKRKHKKIGKIKHVEVDGINWYLMHGKAPCDNGFTRISLFDKTGLYPENTSVHGRENGYLSGEKWLHKKVRGTKYRFRMLLAEPNMGMMMDCAYIRGKFRHGKYFPCPNKYFIKPFGEKKIRRIQKNSRNRKFCFIEEMLEPDGWKPDSMKQKHSTADTKVKV